MKASNQFLRVVCLENNDISVQRVEHEVAHIVKSCNWYCECMSASQIAVWVFSFTRLDIQMHEPSDESFLYRIEDEDK